MIRKIYSCLFTSVAATFALTAACHSQFTWTGGGSNPNWNASRTIFFTTYYTNWNDGNATSLPTPGSNVVFADSFDSGNPNINGNRSVNQLQIDSITDFVLVGSGTLTIGNGINRTTTSGGTQTLDVNIQNNSSSWTIRGTGELIVSRPVSGFAITKTGAGTLTLTGGANLWSGQTIVADGRLNLSKTPGSAPGFGGAVPSNLTVLLAGQVYILQPHQIHNQSIVTLYGALNLSADEGVSRLVAEGGVINGSATLSLHNLAQAITGKSATINCPVNLNPDNTNAPAIFSTVSGHTLMFTNTLSNGTTEAGSLAKHGLGTLVLSGGSAYSGGTNVTEGILQVSNATGSATGSGNTEIQSGARLTGTGSLTQAACKSEGIISPGVNSKSQLTISTLSLESGAILEMEVGDSSNDKINSQTATQLGALTINLVRKGALSAGEEFILIDSQNAAYIPHLITVNSGDVKGSIVIDSGQLKYLVSEAPAYVNAAATGAGDGTTWQDAFTDLNTAINSISGSGVIYVAEGTYKPSESDKNASFGLKSNVRIYGGFPNQGSPSAADRKPLLHPTILDGGDFNYNVVTAVSVNSGCVLDGFVITGGNAEFAGNSGRGGGIFISGDPIIANCVIRNNRAAYGGGIHASGNPLFINCVIINNKADKGDGFGGGMSISGIGTKIYNCTIAANDAAYGGGIYAADTFTTGAVQVRNSIVWLNTAYSVRNFGGLNYLFSIQNSNVEPGFSSGNISLNPLFISANDGIFALSPNSPSVNQGSNAALPADLSDCDLDGDTSEPLPFDISFAPRISGANVEQGAYEVQATSSTPSAPVFNSLNVISPGQVNLAWAPVNGQGVTGYNVHRSTVFDFPASPMNRITSGVTATNYNDTTVTNGTVYYYKITSVTASGESVQSNMLSASVPAVPEVLYVSSSAAPGGNGTSWTLAYNDLQDALARARSGDQVWVAGGLYKTSPDVPGKLPNRFNSFEARAGVTILGGFLGVPGDEGNLSLRQPSLYTTVLSGGIGSGANYDNAFTVFRSLGQDGGALLDGFTITSGNATGPFNINQWNGGGLKLNNSSMTVRNCIIESNYSNAGSGMFVTGGSPVFQNCIIRSNHTVSSNTAGGGIWASGTLAQFQGCLIMGNTATSSGAGVYFESPSGNPQLINCTIAANHAGAYGGGVAGGSSGKAVVANSILWGNTTGYLGSQIYLLSGASLTARNSIIQDGFAGTNISASDPHFISGSFRIPFGSSAANSGDPLDLPAALMRDLDGAPRTIGIAVDLGAYEAYLPEPVSSAKQQPDGTTGMTLADKIVTVVGPDYLYVQDSDRSSGMKVMMPLLSATPGDRLNSTGTIKTDANDERYFEAESAYILQSGPPVEPLKMVTRDLGGNAVTSINPTGGQMGPTGGIGLNNVGLFVRVAGKITAKNPTQGWVTVSDGSRNSAGELILDMDGNPGIRVYLKDSSVIASLIIGADFVAEGASALRKADQLYSVVDSLNN